MTSVIPYYLIPTFQNQHFDPKYCPSKTTYSIFPCLHLLILFLQTLLYKQDFFFFFKKNLTFFFAQFSFINCFFSSSAAMAVAEFIPSSSSSSLTRKTSFHSSQLSYVSTRITYQRRLSVRPLPRNHNYPQICCSVKYVLDFCYFLCLNLCIVLLFICFVQQMVSYLLILK